MTSRPEVFSLLRSKNCFTPRRALCTVVDQVKAGFRLSAARTFTAPELERSRHGVPAALTSKFISRMIESAIDDCQCQDIALDFLRPVRTGEIVSITVEVTRVFEESQSFDMRVNLSHNGDPIACGVCSVALQKTVALEQMAFAA